MYHENQTQDRRHMNLTRLQNLGLLTLPLAPLLSLFLIAKANRGHDLTALFFSGVALLFGACALLVGFGLRKHRPGWVKSGTVALLVLLLSCLLELGFKTYWSGYETAEVVIRVED